MKDKIGDKMAITVYNSPIGKLLIEAIDDHITMITNEIDDVMIQTVNDNELLEEAKRQLDEYFAGKRKTFTLPLAFNGTKYMQTVWAELLKIPYGTTISYGELAAVIGNDKGARSVGMACGKNKIMIVVPCHRIIGKNGKLTGYSGGLEIKKQLLELENNNE